MELTYYQNLSYGKGLLGEAFFVVRLKYISGEIGERWVPLCILSDTERRKNIGQIVEERYFALPSMTIAVG